MDIFLPHESFFPHAPTIKGMDNFYSRIFLQKRLNLHLQGQVTEAKDQPYLVPHMY